MNEWNILQEFSYSYLKVLDLANTIFRVSVLGQDAVVGLPPLLGVLSGALLTLALVSLVLLVKSRRDGATGGAGLASGKHHQNHGQQAQQRMLRVDGIDDGSGQQEKPASEMSELTGQQYHNRYPVVQSYEQTVDTDPDVIPNKFEGNLIEVSPPSYPGTGYSPGQWVTPGPTPSMDELCHKFTGRPTELRLPPRSGSSHGVGTTLHQPISGTASQIHQTVGPCVVVAGECLDGEAIRRRLMANRLPESCV
ncbi:hypothetical protein QAD02_005076 [Eretmocerus hayati]|uniref:Uncharacterized protein n=1 Tax=Eretmocerus hayati TaxID=131215 RepID=A0ACC2NRT7_9HYME|nr:hypothetical protein QAD02_005076 [Eretmocerus hayati]